MGSGPRSQQLQHVFEISQAPTGLQVIELISGHQNVDDVFEPSQAIGFKRLIPGPSEEGWANLDVETPGYGKGFGVTLLEVQKGAPLGYHPRFQ